MIETARLTLRTAEPRDREALIDLHTDPSVRAHLGGPRGRAEVEATVDACLRDPQSGSTVVAGRGNGTLMGALRLDRRDPARPGHVRDEGNELEIAYVFKKAYWGEGLAYEAVSALLADYASEHEDESVILVTQSANARSVALMQRLGFDVLERFEEFGAQQTLAVASLHSFV
ncbi:GNAT family N-acetyltransferase [Leekyejoonella antrihumi]|uniref:GNAT family N-acetyltransferase n=1 Tax=Leekyejoonella antrihumi TaxID=1660198 RepID=A0A563E5X0_9MICO|nr:GNAT family N-acetyltransferase [Leekyejoonella antrihumi]TWP37916.1 GNAT family N-acetyltransferase [Leekyejoonella antrihumi]